MQRRCCKLWVPGGYPWWVPPTLHGMLRHVDLAAQQHTNRGIELLYNAIFSAGCDYGESRGSMALRLLISMLPYMEAQGAQTKLSLKAEL